MNEPLPFLKVKPCGKETETGYKGCKKLFPAKRLGLLGYQTYCTECSARKVWKK